MKYGCCIRHLEELSQVKAAGYDFYEFAGHVVAEMDDTTFDQLCLLTKRLSHVSDSIATLLASRLLSASTFP